MALPTVLTALTVKGVISSISYCCSLYENVKSNQKSCKELGEDLDFLNGILSTVSDQQTEQANKHLLKLVLCKLQNLVNRAKFLFEQSGLEKRRIMIRSTLKSATILGELEQAKQELKTITKLLCLVFALSINSPKTRSVFGDLPENIDSIVWKNKPEDEAVDDYYLPDDTANEQ